MESKSPEKQSLGLKLDSPSPLALRFLECVMSEQAVVAGLLIASLANLICLCRYLA
jgi:hypothetical protein